MAGSHRIPLTLLVAAALAGPAHALYKVVGPDGKVTYTDRPTAEGRATPVGARAQAPVQEVPLPPELRQVASRYPVTLYTTMGACDPCEAGRQLLRQRGVPYAERQVSSAADAEALQKLTGGREAPVLTVGGQVLRGLASDVWNSYLDSAGYPKESKLPAGWQNPAPTPLTEQRSASPATPAPAPAAPAVPRETAPAPAPGTPQIRF